MEIINVAIQTVQPNQDALFANTVVCGGPSIMHRNGSGLVNLRGACQCQCRARFKVYFSGNIAIAAGGTVGPIQLAIALDGEATGSTTMIVTPAAVNDYFNVSSGIFVEVPRGCCSKISVKNISTQAIDLQNANLIVERVA